MGVSSFGCQMNKLRQNEGLEAAGIEQMWPWGCLGVVWAVGAVGLLLIPVPGACAFEPFAPAHAGEVPVP